MTPMEEALRHLETLVQLSRAKRIKWTEMPVDKPGAMRAYEGKAEVYKILVAQANVEGQGVVCDGMATVAPLMVIHLTRQVADELYHAAVAERN